jgi:hypothetical protein
VVVALIDKRKVIWKGGTTINIFGHKGIFFENKQSIFFKGNTNEENVAWIYEITSIFPRVMCEKIQGVALLKIIIFYNLFK